MWSKLFDFVAEFFGQFQCFVYVEEFNRVVVLRKGIYHRTLEPGMRWIIPFSVEDCIEVNIKPEPVYLDIQSLHTKDDYACNIQIGIIWEIIDPRCYLLDWEDTEDIITMECSGIVTETVQVKTWNQMKLPGVAGALRTPFNRRNRKYGVRIKAVVMQDFIAGNASRVWHEGINIDFGEE